MPKIDGEESFTSLCMNIFDLADYFLLPELCKRSEKAFVTVLLALAPPFQANIPRGDVDVTRLFGVVREVYAREKSLAAECFRYGIAMVMNAIQEGLFVENTAFIALIDEISEVAADMMKFVLNHRKGRGFYSESCSCCQSPRTPNLGFSVVFPPMGELICLCYRCDPHCQSTYGAWEP
jgi:hypothetical protein